ncbi:MAG: hypothetical protein EPN94_01665 [Nitrospirae bacterium]|nr:MAG: hypothetical protein EPN94_01665 [Nitrospirota bacterium]
MKGAGKMDKMPHQMTDKELKAELERLRDSLCDLEDMHLFTFAKTSAHIGSEKAQNMQIEFEEECRMLNKRIAEIEKELKTKGDTGEKN